MPKGLCNDGATIVAKSRKIVEKNTAKGQNSLNQFFGQTKGVKSNKAAFDHYVTLTQAYSSKMLSHKPGLEKVENPEIDKTGTIQVK